MRILLCSKEADGAWFVVKLIRGGHDVDWVLGDDRWSDTLKGIVPSPLTKVADPTQYDLVVFDISSNGKMADSILEVTPVIGSSEFADILEHDRLKGIEFMEMCGITVPRYESFDDIGKAAEWVNTLGGKSVFKPFGDIDDKSTTYVANSPEDMIKQMEVLVPKIKGNPFLLQEFVEGTEVSTQAWFNGDEFYAMDHSLEEKKFMSGNIGPNTPCSGSVLWMIKGDKLFDHTLAKCKKLLRKVDFRGSIDLNTIVTADKCFGLEWTPRFGYEDTCNLTKLLPMEFGEFLYKIATGEPIEEGMKSGFAATVRVSIPPYPRNTKNVGDRDESVPIRGIDPEDIDDFFLADVMIDDDGELVSTGIDGMIGAPICTGNTMAEAFAECQKVIDKLEIPDMQYRNDIAECCQRRYDELKSMGWLDDASE